MRLRLLAVIAAIATAIAASNPGVAADAGQGADLAQRWCASCHVIGDSSGTSQQSSVPQGPPSFLSVAQGGSSPDELRAFLSHPHGAMPDLSLTRIEIDDLIAYMTSLR